MRVAERRDADARDEIEIAAPVIVEEPHALAPLEDDRKAAVGLQHVLRFEGANVVGGSRGHDNRRLCGLLADRLERQHQRGARRIVDPV